MCCDFIEKDLPKCFEYISSTASLCFDDFEITVVKEKQQFSSLLKRSVLITNLACNSSKKITHLHLLG